MCSRGMGEDQFELDNKVINEVVAALSKRAYIDSKTVPKEKLIKAYQQLRTKHREIHEDGYEYEQKEEHAWEVAQNTSDSEGNMSADDMYDSKPKPDIAVVPRVTPSLLTLPVEVLAEDLLPFLCGKDLCHFDLIATGTHRAVLKAGEELGLGIDSSGLNVPSGSYKVSEVVARRHLIQHQPKRTCKQTDEVNWKHAWQSFHNTPWNPNFRYQNETSLFGQFKKGPLAAGYQSSGFLEKPPGSEKQCLTLCKSSRECDFDGLYRRLPWSNIAKEVSLKPSFRPANLYFCARSTRNDLYSASVVLGDIDKIAFERIERTGYSNDVREGLISSWCFGVDGKIKIFGPQKDNVMIKDICEYEKDKWYAVRLTFDWDTAMYHCQVRDGSQLYDDDSTTPNCSMMNSPSSAVLQRFEELPLEGSGSVSFWDKNMTGARTMFLFNHSSVVQSWIDDLQFCTSKDEMQPNWLGSHEELNIPNICNTLWKG